MTIDIATDEIMCDESEAQRYIYVLNGLSYHCQEGGWRLGWRNEIVVNLTVSAWELGLDAIEVLNKFIDNGLIDPATDDQSTVGRVNTVLDYIYEFSWDWMIDAAEWEKLGKMHENDELKLRFRLS